MKKPFQWEKIRKSVAQLTDLGEIALDLSGGGL
jgi:hypothetical protein